MADVITLLCAGVVGSDLLLVYLIGVCPAIAVSRKLETAVDLAASLCVVAPVSSLAAYLVVTPLFEGAALRLLALPLIVAIVTACTYAVAAVARRISAERYELFEPFVALMNVNCTLLGVVLLILVRPGGWLQAVAAAAGLALGYGVVLVAFSQVRERLAISDVPAAFRDVPIALLTLAIVALAGGGFHGLQFL
jgi:electron transport complex protein RnfA